MGDSQASEKKGGSRKSLIRNARGAVAVYVAITVPVLFGVGALTLDVGRLITLHTELQAAADAAAIAGARELNRFPGAIGKAREAAAEALRNIQTFATGGKEAILDTTALKTDCGLDPALGVPCIRFLRSLPQDLFDSADPPNVLARGDDLPITGTEFIDPTAGSQDSRDEEARFIDVHIGARDVTNILVRLLIAFGQTPLLTSTTSATAVAGQDQVICNLPPMFICSPTEPDGNTDENLAMDANALSGREVALYFQGEGGTMTPGNFGLLCPLGSEDEAPNCGAKSIRDALASKSGTCLNQQLVTTKTGANVGMVRAGINARFDYFEPQAKTADNVPWRTLDDFTPAVNVTQGGKPKGTGGNKTTCEYNVIKPVGGQEVATEFPRDKCFIDGNCDTVPGNVNGSSRVGDGDWNYQDYFRINHSCEPALESCAGPPDWEPSDWSSVTNGAGWPPTRYETYRYEIERTPEAIVVANKPIYQDDGTTTVSTKENGHQQCFQGTPPAIPDCGGSGQMECYYPDKVRDLRLLNDRRVMPIAIANCNAIEADPENSTKGKFSFQIPEFIYVFLPEVMDKPSESHIYAEIIGTLDEGAIESLVRDVVQIYRRGR
ncbi:MAG: hypothetical protein IIA72_14500 [Proteobacteria bacterium]|nr:hypothetical protein [Pseudomonadota bacterium]